MTDEEIVQKIKEGETGLFNELVVKHQRHLFNIAVRILGNEQDAADAVQAAFVKAFKGLSSYKGRSDFFTWLYRINTNACYLKLRAAKHNPLPRAVSLDENNAGARIDVADCEEHSPEKQAASEELQHIVRGAIGKLPKKLYQVVALKDIEGHSYEEIARILGCSKGTVESRLFRARHKLKGYLDKVHAEL